MDKPFQNNKNNQNNSQTLVNTGDGVGYQAKIAIQAVRSFINYAERRGLNRIELLQVANLIEEQLHDSHLLIMFLDLKPLWNMQHALKTTP